MRPVHTGGVPEMKFLLPQNDDLPTDLYDLLYSLGLTANHIYFFHTAYAVRLAVQNQQRLSLVTKWLYPDVAKHYGSTPGAVERNIRMAAITVWEKNPGLLSQLSCTPPDHRPTTAQFLAILTHYFVRKISPPPAA